MTAYITISEIDFEKSFYSIAPAVLKKLDEKPNPGIAVKLINRLGIDGLPIVLDILNGLTEADKNELVVCVINSFKGKILSAVKSALKSKELDEAVLIQDIRAESCEEKIELIIPNIRLDCGKLAESKLSGGRLNIGGIGRLGGLVGRIGNAFKEPLLNLLNSAEIKARIISFAADSLGNRGIYMKLNDFRVEHSDEEYPEPILTDKASFVLPKPLEDKIIDSTVNYIKRNVSEKR